MIAMGVVGVLLLGLVYWNFFHQSQVKYFTLSKYFRENCNLLCIVQPAYPYPYPPPPPPPQAAPAAPAAGGGDAAAGGGGGGGEEGA